MTFTFRPAKRDKSALMVGIGGPSKSGKTYSALRLATGLALGGPIFMIDTESGRGLQYADKFQYLHCNLDAPFTSERYTEIIDVAVKEKAAVIIVDSMSHEHEGPGGMLERHEDELRRMAGDDFNKRERMNFAAWIKPKRAHNLFVNRVLQINTHFIFCFRAKDKLVLKKNNNKIEPVHIGWQPICSDRFEYETTFILMLPEGARGVPDLNANASAMRDPFDRMIPAGKPIDEQLGRQLAEWAAGGTKPEKPESFPADQPQTVDRLPESVVVDHCSAMEEAISLVDLERAFSAAIVACAKVKDADAKTKFISTKDKCKAKLMQGAST